MRLELIRTLQEHGYTLAAIERVLARIPADATPAEYAVQSAVLAPWLPEQPEEFDRAGLERRVGRRIERRRARLPRRRSARWSAVGDGAFRAVAGGARPRGGADAAARPALACCTTRPRSSTSTPPRWPTG